MYRPNPKFEIKKNKKCTFLGKHFFFFFAPQQGTGIVLQEKGLCVLQYFEPLRTESVSVAGFVVLSSSFQL